MIATGPYIVSCAVALSIAVSSTLHAQPSGNATAFPAKLKGVSKVTVVVDFNVGQTAQTNIREERLRTITELRLRSAGFRVLTA